MWMKPAVSFFFREKYQRKIKKGKWSINYIAVQRNFRVAKVAQRHAICPRVYIGNTVCAQTERERKVFARAQTRRWTRLQLGAAHKYAAACTTREMTGQDVFELDSTRANILRGQTLVATDRIVSSCSLAALARERRFSSSFRYVIHQTSKRFRTRPFRRAV